MSDRTWAAPEIIAVDRLPMHSPLTAYPDLDAARVADRDASPWFRRLDGTLAVPAGARRPTPYPAISPTPGCTTA